MPTSMRRAIPAVIAAVLLGLTFSYNLLGAAQAEFFANWQKDTEAQVLNRIEADRLGINVSPFGLLVAGAGRDPLAAYQSIDNSEFEKTADRSQFTYYGYTGNLGAGAKFYSVLYRYTPVNSLQDLRNLCALLTAIALLWLAWVFARLGAPVLGVVYVACAAFSPWMTVAAPNLCWSPWLWFTPAIAVGMALLAERRWARCVWWATVPIAFAVKYVFTGYEIATAITLLAMFVPVLPYLFDRAGLRLKEVLLRSLAVGAASIGGFLVALVIHALRREGELAAGLRTIWEQDVQRRTYGDPSKFVGINPAEYGGSLSAGPLDVLVKYVTGWQTTVLDFQSLPLLNFSMNSGGFWLMVLAAVGICLYRQRVGSAKFARDSWLIVIGLVISVSWMFAGKGHAWVHTHILFFLWYLGLVPFVMFVVVDLVIEKAGKLRNRGGSGGAASEPPAVSS